MTCYPSCSPPSSIVTHAPTVVHHALAFTGFASGNLILAGVVCLAIGAGLLSWALRRAH
jgi:hypothetical protein